MNEYSLLECWETLLDSVDISKNIIRLMDSSQMENL